MGMMQAGGGKGINSLTAVQLKYTLVDYGQNYSADVEKGKLYLGVAAASRSDSNSGGDASASVTNSDLLVDLNINLSGSLQYHNRPIRVLLFRPYAAGQFTGKTTAGSGWARNFVGLWVIDD